MARLIIAGGGIAGLAAAISAASNGYTVVVLERQPDFRELGAGIQLAPNAFRALEHLGVADQVRARSVFIDELRLMDAVSGDQIARMNLGDDFRERFGQPYAVVHRGDLYEPLLRACREHPAITLRGDCRVTGYQLEPEGVSVRLASGERIFAAGLVGADGLRSQVRGQLLGDGPPRLSGHTIYRSVVPMANVDVQLRSNSATLWAGPGYHMVHYPIAHAASLNLAITIDDGAQQEVIGRPVTSEQVLARFPTAHPGILELLRLAPEWHSWVLCDRDPVPSWTDGPVVLLGDAAHPMLQYAAQGAAMALEDAVGLDAVLSQSSDLVEIFAAFTTLRSSRVARIQLLSRQIGDEIYHPTGAVAHERDRWFGELTDRDQLDQVSWLYGYEATPVRR